MHRLTLADIVRVPLGLVMAYIGGMGFWKGLTSFDGSVPSILILLLAVGFGLVFIAIGLVMSFGWIWAKPRRRS